jgi:hypothetical protein
LWDFVLIAMPVEANEAEKSEHVSRLLRPWGCVSDNLRDDMPPPQKWTFPDRRPSTHPKAPHVGRGKL